MSYVLSRTHKLFVFLFADGETVELHSTWTPAQGFTGVVLHIECVFSGEEEERQLLGWSLRVHPDSPQALLEIVLDDRCIGAAINHSVSMAYLRDGKVIGFSPEKEQFLKSKLVSGVSGGLLILFWRGNYVV